MEREIINAVSSTEATYETNGSLSSDRVRLSTQKRVRDLALVACGITVFILLGLLLFRSTGQDDCYISYWPAHTLAHFGRILNYNGEAVEQSSSMLWVLALGALAFISRAPVSLLGPLLSIAGGAIAIQVAARLAIRIDPRSHPYAVGLTATAAYLLYWSFSGMESSFVGVCTAWMAVTYSDYLAGEPSRKVEIGAATVCCVLVRPEMGIVLGVFLVGMFVVLAFCRKRGTLTAESVKSLGIRIGILALIVLVISAGTAFARLGYFHSPVPEPALVKGGKQSHIYEGLTYLLRSVQLYFVVPAACLTIIGLFLAIKDVFKARTLNMARTVCMILLIVYCSFIIWVGGDWMLAGRFLVHVVPIAMVLAADGMSRITPRRLLPSIGLTITLVQLSGCAWYASMTSVAMSPPEQLSNLDSRVTAEISWFDRSNRLFMRDAPVAVALDRVVARLIEHGHPVAHIFTGQMGIVMFHLATHRFGQIDVTDRHGLADRRMVTCSLAADRRRLTNGLAVEYSWYLTNQQELERVCGIPSPEIIYDIEDAHSLRRARVIQLFGYALVYHKICTVPTSRGWLHGSRVELNEYIAVRRDILPILEMREVPADRFEDATR